MDPFDSMDVPAFASLCLQTAAEEEKAVVRTPGGRVGNDRSTGSRSNRENWVEQTSSGHLPRYIRIVRNGLMREGMPEGRATGMAVAAIKRWAKGGDNVSPKVQAAAAKALAEWNKMKGEKSDQEMIEELETKGTSFNPEDHPRTPKGKPGGGRFTAKDKDKNSGEDGGKPKKKRGTRKIRIVSGDTLSELAAEYDTTVERLMRLNPKIKDPDLIYAGDDLRIPGNDEDEDDDKGKDSDKKPRRKRSEKSISGDGRTTIPHVADEDVSEEKADHMNISHKAVSVCGLKTLEDEGDGIITAFVSVTGIKDNVNDIIEPGAYEKTLAKRLPKGVWSHDWNTPVSKTLEAKELMPGDPELPKTLPNGEPWPAEAGALKIKTQFNLDTQRGRDAYADVKFFADQQEWSIGYNVPVGGSTKDAKVGARRIQTLDLYEFSPVLFGAMPSARTAMGVKAAQFANLQYKSALGDDYYVRYDIEELDEFVAEAKALIGTGLETKSHSSSTTSPADEHQTEYDSDDDVLPIFNEKGILSADNVHLLEKAAGVLTELIDAIQYGDIEQKSIETKETVSLTDSLDALYDTDLEEKTVGGLADSIDEFETAMAANDEKTAESAAMDILDFVDDNLDNADEKTAESLRDVAKALQEAVMASEKTASGQDEDEDEYEDEKPPKPREETQGEKDEEKISFDTTEVKSLEDFFNSL